MERLKIRKIDEQLTKVVFHFKATVFTIYKTSYKLHAIIKSLK